MTPYSGRTDSPKPLAALMLALIFCAAAAGAADGDLILREIEYHRLSATEDFLTLSNTFVLPESVQLSRDAEIYTPGVDFRVMGDKGLVLLLGRLTGARSGPGERRFLVKYAYRPALLNPDAVLHPFTQSGGVGQPVADGLETATAGITPATVLSGGGDLDVRGSKSVRMASGSRKEMTVDQTLRLDISGMLTEDIKVVAHLSDDDLPVIPEGSTEELRDVDRVHVAITAPDWQAVLGDFKAQRGGSVYGDYQRKLQGISVSAGDRRGVAILAGTPRGRYRTLQIRGEESKQGPYYLGGGDTGNDLLIVAGSERVYLDGRALVRGRDRDYTIDYVRGTLSFTYRNLIVAESEIMVEFEEGEGAYVRSTSGIEGWSAVALPFAEQTDLKLRARLIVETDDADRPRIGGLDPDERDTLADAGDNPLAALTSGLQQVPTGEGQYRLETVGGLSVAVYDTLAGDHNVEFRHVGSGVGDYAISALTPQGERIFSYQGPGGGSYLIGRALTLPASRRLLTLQADIGDPGAAGLGLEYDAGANDLNTLSERDDQDNAGRALYASARSGRRALSLGDRQLAAVSIQAVHSRRDERFLPFQNDRDRFHYDRWGLAARAAAPEFLTQSDRESQVDLRLDAGRDRHRLDLRAELGRLDHGPGLDADRRALEGRWTAGRLDGVGIYQQAAASDVADPMDIDRRRHDQQLGLDLGRVRANFASRREEYRDRLQGAASAAGARNRQWQYGLQSGAGAAWDWTLDFKRGLADSARSDGWGRERDSRTGAWRVETPAAAGMRLSADGTIRNVKTRTGNELRTRLAKLNLSGRWEASESDWSLLYGVDNSRTEVLDRQIVYIGLRQGDYNQDGVFVGYQQGDFRVVTVGTDSLVATTEATADLTWRQGFSFLGRDRFWGGWNSFTRVSVRSRSRDQDLNRLLRFAPGTIFDSRQTVLGEFSLRQELNLLRHLEAWDLRLRLDMDQALDRQYALHPENRLRRVHQGTLNYSLDRRSSLRWRSRRNAERRGTAEDAYSVNRSYDSVETAHSLEWQFRPDAKRTAALGVDVVERSDRVSEVAQTERGLHLNLRQSLRRDLSLIADTRYASVDSREPAAAIRPFFYPYGGRNVEGNLRLSWEATGSITASLVYFGRRQGDRGWQHDFRLESTARF